MKKVLISIKSCQSSEQPAEQPDEEGVELVTDGEYSFRDGTAEFSYVESKVTGDYAGTKTSFVIEPDRVVLKWADGIVGEIIFSEGRKHHFVSETEFGSLTVGIDTQSVVKEMDENGGSLEIYYVIDVENVVVSRKTFKINVK